ncbi:hypothetical protein [Desertivirga xinjiangensis]|uniref:hypothetical protein n=1 Tax=Desertivirga xinjiangensis TaxID=539206 RepID=UPI002109AD50|nr:hypothetical protein [Pedobacter xinjiangensis]
MDFECGKGAMPNQRDVILERETNLKIQVFNQSDELFVPNGKEVHFFGDNFGEVLAFETIGYQHESEAFILSAIKWYADYLGFSKMKIYRNNPIL